MISFQNFSFRYEESKDFTLRGIDMTVQTGEFILLTGRSGCGKTTLIRSLNGLIPHFYDGYHAGIGFRLRKSRTAPQGND